MKKGLEPSIRRGGRRGSRQADVHADQGPDILTIEDVASYLRLKPQTIYRWAQARRIPAAKLGKEWRFRKSLLDRWLDGQMLEDPAFAHLRGDDGDRNQGTNPPVR
jgi:excisionase family DNA binding protein